MTMRITSIEFSSLHVRMWAFWKMKDFESTILTQTIEVELSEEEKEVDKIAIDTDNVLKQELRDSDNVLKQEVKDSLFVHMYLGECMKGEVPMEVYPRWLNVNSICESIETIEFS